MIQKIFVLIDHNGESIRTAAWEALVMGQQLANQTGGSIHAVLPGSEIGALAEELAAQSLASVIRIEDPKLKRYDPDCSSAAICQLLEQQQPDLLLMGHTYQNIDLAPKVSAALGKGLITDCIGFQFQEEHLVFVRQMFRNKLNALVRINSPRPWLVSIQSGSFSADDLEAGEAPIVQQAIDLSGVQPRRAEMETIRGTRGTVDLSKAEVIVGVGRGIKKEENLKIIRELAEVLGAEIGASRPVVDNQWLERERQIGSSGQSVSPRLYIACGISGAIQHIVGMKASQCIVAVNTDPNAPIFNVATYGIVGDLAEIIPALTAKLKETA